MEKMGMHCGRLLSHMMDHDENIFVLDGDLADSNGAIFVHERHPDRFIMTGIAEQNMVSMAAGLATTGRKPWVFSFASFLCYRAYDQIRIGLSQACTSVKLVGSHAGGFTGRNGQTHAAINDIAIMSSLPNITIWSPSCPRDLAFAMKQMAASNGPAYLRLPREPLVDLDIAPSSWGWIVPPQKINIVACGIATHIALRVKAMLEQDNIAVGILNVNKITPLDDEMIRDINRSTKHLVVLEDHYRAGGFENLLHSAGVQCAILSKSWNVEFTGESGDFDDVLGAYNLDPLKIAVEIKKIYKDAFHHSHLA